MSSNIEKNAARIFIVIAVVFILKVLQPLLVPIIFAVILSILVFPVVKFLEKKWRFNRVLSAVTVLMALAVVMGVIINVIFFGFKTFADKSDLYTVKLTEMYNNLLVYLTERFYVSPDDLQLSDIKFEELLKNNFSKIGTLLSQSGNFISDLVLMPIYIFFFLLYRKFFLNFIYKLFPNTSIQKQNIILRNLYEVQRSYLAGLSTVMIIVGVLNSIGLLLLGIENAVFFGFFGALLLLIPYIGIIIGSLIPALVALVTKDSYWYAIGVIGVFAFVQFLEGNFITPKITGSKVSVNAFIAIFSLLVFSMLWGTAGMILALPITASLKVLFDHIPSMRAYGFLIGEPLDQHLQSAATSRLKKWKAIRKNKKVVK